jgi:hypothetical protein
VIKQKRVNGYPQQYSGHQSAKARFMGFNAALARHPVLEMAPYRRTNVP